MKKLIPVLLSLFMALAMTATALAATVYTEGALHYTIADESITITGYFGNRAGQHRRYPCEHHRQGRVHGQ